MNASHHPVLAALAAASLLAAPASLAQDRYPSLVSEVLATYQPAAPAGHSPEAIAAAAQAFLDSLGDTLRGQAALPADSDERQKWTNVPPSGPQGGVRLGDCDEGQLEKACDFLRAAMSQQGYEKARNILLADDELLENGQPRAGFGAENFWLAIFGKPSPGSLWAFQLDGHHVAFNFTYKGEQVTMSPSFIGTQPAAFKLAGKTVVVMEGEDTGAFKLVQSLGDKLRGQAIVSPVREQIAAGAGKDGFVPKQVGAPCSAFDASQRQLLLALVRQYTGDLPEPYAGRRLEQLAGEIDRMTFAWSGPVKDGSDVSYRIQGPSVLIEYACQDLGGNPRDHLHSMYRDPTNEYGKGFE
jgi:hypothetical protein